MNKLLILWLLLISISPILAQKNISLENILHRIEETHPDLKMMDAKVKELDAYAEGARNWEAPKFGAGFFMTPYNYMMWSRVGALYHEGMNQGMGSFMVQGEQMIPCLLYTSRCV